MALQRDSEKAKILVDYENMSKLAIFDQNHGPTLSGRKLNLGKSDGSEHGVFRKAFGHSNNQPRMNPEACNSAPVHTLDFSWSVSWAQSTIGLHCLLAPTILFLLIYTIFLWQFLN